MDLNEMDPLSEEEFEEEESGDAQEELSMALSLLEDCVKKMESAIGDGNPHRLTWMIIKEMKDTALEATAFLDQYEVGRDYEEGEIGDQPPSNYNPEEEGEKKPTVIELVGECCYPKNPMGPQIMIPRFRNGANLRADLIRVERDGERIVEGEVVEGIDYMGESWD